MKFDSDAAATNIVTVLLHDYFHRGAFKQVIGEKQWHRFESRLDKNADDALQLFNIYKVKATFFTLGWIAEKNPEIIRRIVSEGHEIADAGYTVRSVGESTPDQFRESLRRSRQALEAAGANRIVGFRSAWKWLRKKDFWALEVLANEGYRYDASYRPAWISFFDQASHRYQFTHSTRSGAIVELPTPTYSLFGVNLPIAGGSYLRLLPHWFLFACYRRWNRRKQHPFVLYFHPWELDRQQPVIDSAGPLAKIKQYTNLGELKWILPRYFGEGKFTSVSDYLGIPLIFPEPKERGAIDLSPPHEKGGAISGNVPVVSIVIPCYNETSSIPYLAKALDEFKDAAAGICCPRFIFVDDKSTDDTNWVLQQTFGKRNDCRIVRHEKNQGVAAALQTGMQAAETEIVCTIDADCSYDPLDLLKMIQMLDPSTDMIVASPYHRNGFVFGVPRWRLSLSRGLSRLYHLLLHHKFATYTSCFRVCRRTAVASIGLKNKDFRGIVELVARLDIAGGKMKEFPTTLNCRVFGQSKMKVAKTIVGHLFLLLELIREKKRIRRSRK